MNARPRRVTRAAMVAFTAAATAVGIGLTAGPVSAAPRAGTAAAATTASKISMTSFVLSHLARALNETQHLVVTQTVIPAGVSDPFLQSFVGTWNSYILGDRVRFTRLDTSGNPVQDAGVTSLTQGASPNEVLVDYPSQQVIAFTKINQSQGNAFEGGAGCEAVAAGLIYELDMPVPVPGSPDESTSLLTMLPVLLGDTNPAAQQPVSGPLTCDGLTITGVTFQGTAAYEIVLQDPGANGNQTMWVNASTFLPMAAQVSLNGSVQETVSYAWLRPKGPSLALLNVPTPAGFTDVTDPEPIP